MNVRNSAIPPRLSHRISPGLLVFTGTSKSLVKAFGIAVTLFGLFGTIVPRNGEHPHHCTFLFFLGPWIFPAIVAATFTLSPFRPYQSVVFLEKTRPLKKDEISAHLLQLLRSAQARRFLWLATLKLSILTFVFMGILSVFVRNSLSWSLSPADLGSAGLAVVGSLFAISADYIGWALRMWSKREGSESA